VLRAETRNRAARAVGHGTTVPNRAGPAAGRPGIAPDAITVRRPAAFPALRARIPHADRWES